MKRNPHNGQWEKMFATPKWDSGLVLRPFKKTAQICNITVDNNRKTSKKKVNKLLTNSDIQMYTNLCKVPQHDISSGKRTVNHMWYQYIHRRAKICSQNH